MNQTQLILTIALLAFTTMATRFIPFLYYQKRELTPWITFLTQRVPMASMGLLVIYGLKDISSLTSLSPYVEVGSLALIALVYRFSKSTLSSLFIGVGVYLLIVNQPWF